MATATKKAKKAKSASARAKRAVVVTTKHYGVFFGRTDAAPDASTATFDDFRNCLYWAKSVGGVFGLAEVGPNKDCRIGVKRSKPTTIVDITSVSDCTEAAAAAWDSAPSVS